MPQINKIDGNARTVRALLGEKYGIDYYQREYRWRRQDVEAMLEDLETRFSSNFAAGDSRQKVQQYAHYFLGPIVVSRKDGKHFLIDGQQRLTTLTLLLVYLNHLQSGRGEIVRIDDLIYSERYGQKSFHLDVDERRDAMLALFEGRAVETPLGDGSVANLVARYADIEALFPEHLATDAALPYFLDWLLDNVELVEITTYNDEDAYAIFETMNDRGLSLTPAEMLKAYLLSKLDSNESRGQTDALWRRKMAALAELEPDEDANFFKAWMRGQFADSIRERRAGASNQDFEHIGTAFHKWVRDQGGAQMGLHTSSEFQSFLEFQFPRAVSSYLTLRRAESEPEPELEYLFYNAVNGFTLQPTLLLAALRPDDDEAAVQEKLRLVAGYIDLFIFRRVVNSRTLGYSAISYTMFNVIRDIRGKSVEDLAAVLISKAAELDEEAPLDGILELRMHQQNKNRVRSVLARLTAHLEAHAGSARPAALGFWDYVRRNADDPFEVEHIMADKPERYVPTMYPDEHVFADERNRLGALLLVPKSFNASYGALPYDEKRPHYYSQNLLAKTLTDGCYSHNPRFLAYKQRLNLQFEPVPVFDEQAIRRRQEIYRDLAAEVWSRDRFEPRANRATDPGTA
ncbi:MAG: DUF262 domain-containing HNH endonuclease family protein [Solirubrobacteraceae bacterium]